jgi:hypothetical protein
MTTSWKEVYQRIKMNGLASGPRGSDETSTNSDADTVNSTPKFSHRSSLDNEWQMNYIINRRDGL